MLSIPEVGEYHKIVHADLHGGGVSKLELVCQRATLTLLHSIDIGCRGPCGTN